MVSDDTPRSLDSIAQTDYILDFWMSLQNSANNNTELFPLQ